MAILKTAFNISQIINQPKIIKIEKRKCLKKYGGNTKMRQSYRKKRKRNDKRRRPTKLCRLKRKYKPFKNTRKKKAQHNFKFWTPIGRLFQIKG